MKKIIFFLLLALCALCGTAFAQADSTAAAGINLGGLHISWVLIVAILTGIEGILRALPTGKYASLLGIIHWIDNLLPSNDKKIK